MSIDYPNREDWLAKRFTPHKLQARKLSIKGEFVAGRNKAKRLAREAARSARAMAVATNAGQQKIAKHHFVEPLIVVLSDRRLRQRQGTP